MFRILNPYLKIFFINKRKFHTNKCLLHFYEEPRSGYPVVCDKPPKKLSFFEKYLIACNTLKEEYMLFVQETRNKFKLHRNFVIPNEEDVVWKFDGTEKSLDQWIVTCDSDYKEGYSIAKLELSPCGTGLFHGILNPIPPNDGRTQCAGFCNITTIPKLKAFKISDYYKWGDYNELILKVRGDGRCYMLNILQRGPIDVTWYYAFHYLMYTRGGPYWQHIKIPFSKFVFSSKGEVQDIQFNVVKDHITGFGITLADAKPGPFKLEIDSIAVCFNPSIFESTAYELNDMSK